MVNINIYREIISISSSTRPLFSHVPQLTADQIRPQRVWVVTICDWLFEDFVLPWSEWNACCDHFWTLTRTFNNWHWVSLSGQYRVVAHAEKLHITRHGGGGHPRWVRNASVEEESRNFYKTSSSSVGFTHEFSSWSVSVWRNSLWVYLHIPIRTLFQLKPAVDKLKTHSMASCSPPST